jgi:hypothetical protein
LGFRTSPKTAKADTKSPPTMNLMKVSIMIASMLVSSAWVKLLPCETADQGEAWEEGQMRDD